MNPSNINYRANVWALKQEGCTCIITTTACGSLRENVHPGEVVIIDQFIDWSVTDQLSLCVLAHAGRRVG